MDHEEVSLDSEHQAHLAKERRDYAKAIEHATLARDAALLGHDSWAYCRLSLDMARYQYSIGLLDECIHTLEALLEHPAVGVHRESGALAQALLSEAFRTKGDIDRAVAMAQVAVSVAPDISRELRLALQHSLVSALAEDGEAESAWLEAAVLESLVGPESGVRERGQAYWSIGNTAFGSGRIEQGRKYHRLAAETLGSLGDVNLWALFNKASANLRLDAGLNEPETLECIERAEVAISVSDGNMADILEIRLVRARWELAIGNRQFAEDKLRSVAARAGDRFPFIRAEALQMLAVCLLQLERNEEAHNAASESAQLFTGLGAGLRASKVRALVDTANEHGK